MKKKTKPIVSIIMGSDSDMPVMREAADVLEKFGIPHEVKILSAHRSPEATRSFAQGARAKGTRVIIAGAGGAAHLAGVVAAYTTLPVIGVPLQSKLNGLDSLLSIVQMPSGVPVATVSIGTAGARNAAILAAQVLGVTDAVVEKRLARYKKELADKVAAKNKRLSRK